MRADHDTPDFLAQMVAAAQARVAAARRERPLPEAGDPRRPADGREGGRRPVDGREGGCRPADGRESRRPPTDKPATRRLRAALQAAADGGHTGLIAEVKRRSPSKGDIAPRLDAARQARAYVAAGADAVSVLTEPSRFGGDLADLEGVAAAVEVPVLRKDFIVDRYQVAEAEHAGADAVLLIAAALNDTALGTLLDECRARGLEALVEVHDADELRRALDAGADLIGVNNRDLRTLAVDLTATEALAPLAAGTTLLVSESGIGTGAHARRVAAAGARAVLVGEALVRCPHERLPALVADLRRRPS